MQAPPSKRNKTWNPYKRQTLPMPSGVSLPYRKIKDFPRWASFASVSSHEAWASVMGCVSCMVLPFRGNTATHADNCRHGSSVLGVSLPSRLASATFWAGHSLRWPDLHTQAPRALRPLIGWTLGPKPHKLAM